MHNPSSVPFQGHQALAKITIQRFALLLAITALQRPILFKHPVRVHGLARCVRTQAIVAENVCARYRNMNLFPIPTYPVRTVVRTD